MNDFASISNRPRPLRVAGKVYQVHPLSLDDFGDLQVWVDSQFPDPFDLVNAQIEAGRRTTGAKGDEEREPYPMAVQQFMIRTALDMAGRGRRLIGTPEADEKVQSVEGMKELLYLAIRKGDHAFGRAEADDLYPRLSIAQVTQLFAQTGAALVCSDPKAPGADGTPTA